MPEFKARERVRAAEKERELAPYVEAALARKPRLPAVADPDIPIVEAFGRKGPSPLFNNRGDSIPIPTQDPLAARRSPLARSSGPKRKPSFQHCASLPN
jgi:hypothetical protein